MSIHFSCFHGSPKCDRAVLNTVVLPLKSCHLGAGIGETTSNIVKRSRKKKTFSELQEEETQLLKERVYLKKEISTVRATFKEERVRNENLKRIKIDLNLHYGNEPEALTSNGIPSTLPTHAKGDSHLQSSSSEIDKAISNHDRSFLLPDLNMMPSDAGDSGCGHVVTTALCLL
ncbi:hypothetical protein OIU85_017789 [Salix viminalis]|uniref:Uncharacterized protein n=1 Tax=Salix viminalis TaxID=40686 RepID=A0A9Q0VA45_SALVM|nr:hypothetical protein OIU85_017789 [Salix viminalis]